MGKLVKTHKPHPDRLKQADEVFSIRTEVLRMPLDAWRKYEKRWSGTYTGTARAFLTLYGLPGCLSAKCNPREREWFVVIHCLAAREKHYQKRT